MAKAQIVVSQVMKRAAQRRLSDLAAHGKTPSEALMRVAHARRATDTPSTADAAAKGVSPITR